MSTIFCLAKRGRPGRLAVMGLVAGALTSCNLDVNDPDVVTPDDIAGDPASIPVVIAGLVGDFQNAFAGGSQNPIGTSGAGYVLYAGLFTDEFINAGTFPTRIEVDDRDILFQNISLNSDVWEPLNVSRFSADNAVASFLPLVGDPELDDQQDLIQQGIAFGAYYGAYMRVLFAEMFCQSIFGGGDPEAVNFESAPVLPGPRMQDALTLFQQAEAAAIASGEGRVAEAARVGQARANMFLGNYAAAASIAATVDPDFVFIAEYSSNDPAQYNGVYEWTYGDGHTLRWTVGDGNEPSRNFERFAFFDEWVALDLIDPDPGPAFVPFNSSIVIQLQLIYGAGGAPPNAIGQAAPIMIASGFEADMIRAEAAYRAGDMAGAAAIINARITTGDNPHGKAFAPVVFTGVFATDIAEIGRAYLSGLWLTGYRLAFVRRVLRNDGVDLYPPEAPGLDTAFPMAEQELDNNPGVSSVCPSGPPWS